LTCEWVAATLAADVSKRQWTHGTSSANGAPMQWRKAPLELFSFLDEAAGRVEGCEKRIMFGFPAYFITGNMFLAAHQESLVLRLGQAERDAALASGEGFAEFEPMPGRVMKEYLAIPRAIYKEKARLDPLLAKSAGYVRGLPAKKAARGKRQTESAE
jgi:TfoX/Sxy family transcriptional regulator of competence genes